MLTFLALDCNQLAMEARAENIIQKRLMSFAFENIPGISPSFKLAPIHCQEYEYCLYLTFIHRDT